MLHSNFRTFQLAVTFYQQCEQLKCASHLKNQLLRAASSVVLNLSEGSARAGDADRKRFYNIAFASTREVQAILVLVPHASQSILSASDSLGASTYRLCHPKRV
jgi:four helix bundle protein